MKRQKLAILAAVLVMVMTASEVGAATAFAAPGFRTAYNAGEAITPNFWGPLDTATDAYEQNYNNGKRTVQYFDKGRMEVTGGQVTFGLLATEMVTARVQLGDNDFISVPPSTNPVAGDENGEGPTYATLYNNRGTILSPKSSRVGQEFTYYYNGKGSFVEDNAGIGIRTLALTDYDRTTQHNVIQAFRQYRDRVGFSTIGYAISEPFAAYFTVGGVRTAIVVQVFERRVLTYTPDNPPAYQVEMGNIGRHYFRWRRDVSS